MAVVRLVPGWDLRNFHREKGKANSGKYVNTRWKGERGVGKRAPI